MSHLKRNLDVLGSLFHEGLATIERAQGLVLAARGNLAAIKNELAARGITIDVGGAPSETVTACAGCGKPLAECTCRDASAEEKR